MSSQTQPDAAPQPSSDPAEAELLGPSAPELAAFVAAKICHDLISPVSAIVSGLDLLEDDTSQDMHDSAMALISDSARKLEASLTFARVAFGASASAATFGAPEIEKLARGVFEHVRAELDWAVEASSLDKPAARALLNIAQIGGQALPKGGKARVTGAAEDGQFVITLEARGERARLRVEMLEGLNGLMFSEGMAGQWIQGFFLHALVAEAGGALSTTVEPELVTARIVLPLQ